MLKTTRSTVHDELVHALVRRYEKDGYSVQADDIGYPNGAPALINGHYPDVIAVMVGHTRIAEAETAESIYSSHTRDQWRAFSSELGADFEVIVPKAILEDAKVQAWTWGIRVDHWWWL